VVLPRQAAFRARLGCAPALRTLHQLPDLPWDGIERAGHVAAKAGDPSQIADAQAALVRHGEAVGLQFRFDLIERLPNTRRSHLLIAHAGRNGLAAEVTERVMQAYFEEGRDIGDTEELVRLAVEAGLAEREARAAVVLREGQDGIVAAERHATVLGISGVPAFIFDRQYSVSGAQEVEAFVRVIDQVVELAASRELAS
jgi:predicted DsbA family dithiol-disulfide isomerase